MALFEASKETIYARNMLEELKFFYATKSATTTFCDNQGAQKLVKNPIYHSRKKHIDIRHHYIRETYEKAIIDPQYPTKDMIADILTKGCLDLIT